MRKNTHKRFVLPAVQFTNSAAPAAIAPLGTRFATLRESDLLEVGPTDGRSLFTAALVWPSALISDTTIAVLTGCWRFGIDSSTVALEKGSLSWRKATPSGLLAGLGEHSTTWTMSDFGMTAGRTNIGRTFWLALGAWLLVLAPALSADLMLYERTIKAGEHRISQWTSEQGLPQNTVSSLCQDQSGYLWIGTRYGLVRYDGCRFVDFSDELGRENEGRLDVRSVARDTCGRLWLATAAGLILWDQGRFQLYPCQDGSSGGSPTLLRASRRGGVWVAQGRALHYVAPGQSTRTFAVPEIPEDDPQMDGGKIEALCEDAAGNLWMKLKLLEVAVDWFRLDPESGETRSLSKMVGTPLTDVSGWLEDRQGRWWLARASELLCWGGGRLEHHTLTNAWIGHRVYQMAEDARGHLWITSAGPVQLHRFADGVFTSYGAAQGTPGTSDVRALLPDREGNIWVGTGNRGLLRFQPRAMVSMLAGLFHAMDEVYSVTPGQDGVVWLATTYGLVRWREGQFQIYTNAKALNNTWVVPRVRPVLEDRSGQVWFGLDHEGLHTLAGGRIVSAGMPRDLLPNRDHFHSLFEDRAGSLWIATAGGLIERSRGNYRLWSTNDGLSANYTSGLAETPDGSLWIGTDQGGLNQLKDGRFRVFGMREGLLSQTAWPLRAEADGSIWVGTPRGINRIRGSTVSAVTRRNGLYDDLVYCLLEDRQGRFYWSFSNRGIFRIRKADLHAVADGRESRVTCINYGEDDGMASSEGNGDEQPNAAVLPGGQIWFPTTRGVVTLDPATLRDNEVPPSAVIEEVRVDEELVFKDGRCLPEKESADNCPRQSSNVRPQAAPVIDLAPGRARVLEIIYSGVTFMDSEKAWFRYQLEGHDPEWRQLGNRRVALYTNLRPGSYRFRVEACNHHGYRSARPAELLLTLAPHFYQRREFGLLCAGLAAGSLGTWHVRRLRARRRLHRLERAEARNEERDRIAKDLHDEMGAGLTALGLRLEIARRHEAMPENASKLMAGIGESMRTVAERMREMVWTINPRYDTIENLIAYLGRYAESFTTGAELELRLDFPEEVPTRAVSANARHQILMILKEALNNVVKHAAAGEVRITIALAGGNLALSIADNGAGMPVTSPGGESPPPSATDAPQGGYGLRNMASRTEHLGGRFQIQSRPGEGTRILVEIPLPVD